ncbi:hypothetical protein L596_012597 [Steinernema carpocapsae]|uniref:Uncharacterized protein n=1 Tax=Steinernema carpocapsae TaxID=34508 RepID=A0A4U5NYD0_STECR|nr:hypothetical protein L596_012597 [Steinernema carpocapsae]
MGYGEDKGQEPNKPYEYFAAGFCENTCIFYRDFFRTTLYFSRKVRRKCPSVFTLNSFSHLTRTGLCSKKYVETELFEELFAYLQFDNLIYDLTVTNKEMPPSVRLRSG